MKNKAGWAVFIAAFFAAYAAVFPGDFHYDDYHSIRDNAALTRASNLPRFFGNPAYFSVNPAAAMYRPLLLASYALDYQVFGWRAWGWHLTNLLLHLANALLLWALIERTFGRRRPAWVAALLFAFQPIAGENVNYLNCRSSILVTTFMLAGLLCVRRLMVQGDFRRRIFWIALCCLFFISGLLSKDSAAVFPGMALLYLWIFHRGSGGEKFSRALAMVMPLAFILVGYLYLRNEFFASIFTGASIPRQRLVNLYTELKSYFWYAGLFAWPVRLSIEHGGSVEPGLLRPRVLLSLAGLLSIFALVIYSALRPRSKVSAAGFFAGFYVLALLPTASIIPLNVLVSERALYPALPGLAALAALLIDGVIARRRVPALAMLGVILVFYGVMLFSRGRDWQDELKVWVGALEMAPDNGRVLSELGRRYYIVGKPEKALRYVEKSSELLPEQPAILFNLGSIYLDLGRLEDAEKYFRKVLDKGQDTEALVKLALVHEKQGKAGLAIMELENAVEIAPDSGLARSRLGELYYTAGRKQDAEEQFRFALEIDPGLETANWRVGMSLFEQGDYAAAASHFEKAYQAAPKNAVYAACAAMSLLRLDQSDQGESWAKRSVEADPEYGAGWYYLGLAQVRQGKKEQARQSLQKASKYASPDDQQLSKAIVDLLSGLGN